MKLKIRKEFENGYIWVPFVRANVMGKFIEEGLYPHLYKLSPELFEIVEPIKGLKQKIEEIKKDDISINIDTNKGDTTK